jgi:hypothetical protein
VQLGPLGMPHSAIARKRLLLVWLMPYLLLTFASGGLHTDDLWADSSGAERPEMAAQAGPTALSFPSDSSCIACQWLLASSACSQASPGLAAIFPSQAVALPTPEAESFDVRVPHFGRAPPLAV